MRFAAVFGAGEISADDELNAHAGKKIAGGHRSMNDLGLALSKQCSRVHGGKGMRGHRLEAARLTAPVAKIGRCYLQLRQSGMRFPDANQLAGIAKRQWPYQDGVDDAEESGVRADAQRDG